MSEQEVPVYLRGALPFRIWDSQTAATCVSCGVTWFDSLECCWLCGGESDQVEFDKSKLKLKGSQA